MDKDRHKKRLRQYSWEEEDMQKVPSAEDALAYLDKLGESEKKTPIKDMTEKQINKIRLDRMIFPEFMQEEWDEYVEYTQKSEKTSSKPKEGEKYTDEDGRFDSSDPGLDDPMG